MLTPMKMELKKLMAVMKIFHLEKEIRRKSLSKFPQMKMKSLLDRGARTQLKRKRMRAPQLAQMKMTNLWDRDVKIQLMRRKRKKTVTVKKRHLKVTQKRKEKEKAVVRLARAAKGMTVASAPTAKTRQS